jgi:hypothetical protein
MDLKDGWIKKMILNGLEANYFLNSRSHFFRAGYSAAHLPKMP